LLEEEEEEEVEEEEDERGGGAYQIDHLQCPGGTERVHVATTGC